MIKFCKKGLNGAVWVFCNVSTKNKYVVHALLLKLVCTVFKKVRAGRPKVKAVKSAKSEGRKKVPNGVKSANERFANGGNK